MLFGIGTSGSHSVLLKSFPMGRFFWSLGNYLTTPPLNDGFIALQNSSQRCNSASNGCYALRLALVPQIPTPFCPRATFLILRELFHHSNPEPWVLCTPQLTR